MDEMRIVPTRVHGVMDYLVGALLIAAPWIFGFADVRTAKWTAIAVGAVVLATSLMTNYELGLMRIIPMHLHFGADALVGLFLVVSPWLLGFADDGTNAWLPLLLVGVGELGTAAVSSPWPEKQELKSRERKMAGART